jgi:hypothetical protein
MALSLTGALTINAIHVEAGGTSNTQCSLNDSDIRTLAQKTSGEIGFDDLRGKSGGSVDDDDDGDLGCLVYGTLIEMADGTQKPIEDVVVGDRVVSFNIEGLGAQEDWTEWYTHYRVFGEKTVSTVTANRLRSNGNHYSINNTLKITNEHPVLIKRDNNIAFRYIEEVIVGDKLFNINMELINIDTREKIPGEVQTGDLDVEEVDNYFASNFLVHNTKEIADVGKQ